MRADGQIDYVEFPAINIPQVKAFYAQVFNWRFGDLGPEYTAFEGEPGEGAFPASIVQGPDIPLVVLYADDLEARKAQILAAGGVITRNIFDFPGGQRFHFRDPAGNELAVWSARKPVPATVERPSSRWLGALKRLWKRDALLDGVEDYWREAA